MMMMLMLLMQSGTVDVTGISRRDKMTSRDDVTLSLCVAVGTYRPHHGHH